MISIVIATYNRAATIVRPIESILSQTYRDIEVVVIDDSSTDETNEIITSIKDPRVRYVALPDNQGASAARNRGIVEARGEYIIVWDSDDVLYLHALSRVMQEFERDPSRSIVSAPARVMTAGREIAYLRVPSGDVPLEAILCKKIPSNEKIRIARVGVMKAVSYKSRHIDFLVNVELAERGKWYHIDEYLGDVFNDPAGGSLTAARKKKSASGSIDRAPHLAAFLERHESALLSACPHRYAAYAYGAAIGYLLGGETRRARTFAWNAWKHHPSHLTYLMLWKLAWIPGGAKLLHLVYR